MKLLLFSLVHLSAYISPANLAPDNKSGKEKQHIYMISNFFINYKSVREKI